MTAPTRARRRAACGTRSAYVGGCRCSDCTEANREYQHAWAARNPAARARHAEMSARWARANRERANATDRAWRERNRDRVREQGRARYAAHRDQIAAQIKMYREREQARTVRGATAHGMPWTADQDRALRDLYADPDLTAGDIAIRLNRTAFGVRNRAKVLGLSKRARA